MNIWAPKPPKVGASCSSSVCVKIPYKGFTISIALDDSCGALPNCSRGNIVVFDVCGLREDFGSLSTDAETLKAIFHKIDMMGNP